jgi:hypothetical protein
MNKSDGELTRKRMMGFWWLFVVCFFNTVPLFIISILANLDSVRLIDAPGIEEYSHKYSSGSTFLSLTDGLMHRLTPLLSSPVFCRLLSQVFLDSSYRSSCVG